MNAILNYKAKRGCERRTKLTDATWDDVRAVLDSIKETAKSLDSCDENAAAHIRRNVLPLVESYVRVLQLAEYPADTFFDPDFTIDTGQIVNQGRAKKFFLGLVNNEEEPVTPREARAFGDHIAFRSKGQTLADRSSCLLQQSIAFPARSGWKRGWRWDLNNAVTVHELNENTLRPVEPRSDEPVRRFIVHGLQIELRDLQNGKNRLRKVSIDIGDE